PAQELDGASAADQLAEKPENEGRILFALHGGGAQRRAERKFFRVNFRRDFYADAVGLRRSPPTGKEPGRERQLFGLAIAQHGNLDWLVLGGLQNAEEPNHAR